MAGKLTSRWIKTRGRGWAFKGPPRPGLIPASGDPNKPYRWIKPGTEVSGIGSIAAETTPAETPINITPPSLVEKTRNPVLENQALLLHKSASRVRPPTSPLDDKPLDRMADLVAKAAINGGITIDNPELAAEDLVYSYAYWKFEERSNEAGFIRAGILSHYLSEDELRAELGRGNPYGVDKLMSRVPVAKSTSDMAHELTTAYLRNKYGDEVTVYRGVGPKEPLTQGMVSSFTLDPNVAARFGVVHKTTIPVEAAWYADDLFFPGAESEVIVKLPVNSVLELVK